MPLKVKVLLAIICLPLLAVSGSAYGSVETDSLRRQTLSFFDDDPRMKSKVEGWLDTLDPSYEGEGSFRTMEFFAQKRIKPAILYGLLVGHHVTKMQAAEYLKEFGTVEDLEVLMLAFERSNTYPRGGGEAQSVRAELLLDIRDAVGSIIGEDLSSFSFHSDELGDDALTERFLAAVTGEDAGLSASVQESQRPHAVPSPTKNANRTGEAALSLEESSDSSSGISWAIILLVCLLVGVGVLVKVVRG